MMRKRLLLLCILAPLWCLEQCINASNNLPIVPDYLSTSMRWVVEIVPEEMDGYIDTLRVSADSIVEGLKYKVIRNQLLRQDGHKIYCHFPGDSEFPAQDCLIYDFAPQVGDSIVKRLPGAEGCYHWSIVSKIDSTTLLDGRTARRITYTDNRVCVEFIGDLGGGFLAPTSDGWVEYYNKATYDGETLLFENRRQNILIPQHQPISVPTKQIVNGQLIIEANGQTFDVLGRECK